ncbi:MAG: hypothetical protein EOP11_05430 [Proteobacteria bacterium]|nr:MAG: hypothetical protein EOP11_05430 [Pseudomonadota bacterium]
MIMRKFLFIGLSIMMSANAAHAENPGPHLGHERGNGGDGYAESFIALAREINNSLVKDPIAGVDVKEFSMAISRTRVNSRPALALRGNAVDAINLPDANQILISREGWERMQREPHRRAFLVLHEYLGIMGVDDSTYQISSQLDRAGVCARRPAIREQLEITARKYCYRITAEDLHFMPTELKVPASEEGSERPMAGTDLAGLDRLETFESFETATALKADLFANTPALEEFYGQNAPRIERFLPNSSLTKLGLVELSATAIADNAFTDLQALRELWFTADASQVDLPRAVGSLPSSLRSLSLRLSGTAVPPPGFAEIFRRNPQIENFTVETKAGDIENFRPDLTAAGFACFRNGSFAQVLSCSKPRQ